MTNLWMSIMYLVIGGLIGAALGFFFTKWSYEKQLKENPPITEKQIRALYAQMGRKPSQKQINQVMKSMEKYNK